MFNPTKPYTRILNLRLVIFWFLLSGCTAMDAARLMYGNELASHSWHSKDKQTQIPFESLNQHIIVTASINGVTDLRMVLDTGAAATVLFETQKTQPFLSRLDRKIPVGGIGSGGNSYAYFLHNTDLAIGSVTISDLTTIFIKSEDNPIFSSPDVTYFDGIIGYDLFSRFATGINFTTKVVSISEEANPHINDYQTLPLEIKGNLPYVNISLSDGKTSTSLPVMFDTGGIGSLSITNSSTLPESETLYHSTSSGMGGDSQVIVKRFTKTRIGNYDIANVNVAVSADTNQHSSHNIMGTGLINRFNLIVDYPSKHLYLSPNKNFDKPDYVNEFGATLFPHKNGAMVFALRADSVSRTSGLQTGDVITTINGQNINKDNFDLMYEQLAKLNDTQELCFLRAEKNECKVIQF